MAMKRKLYSIFIIVFTLNAVGLSQDNILVKMERIYPEDIKLAGFQLDQEQTISIEAAGVRQEEGQWQRILGNCWILDSDSRQVVWSLKPQDINRGQPRIQKREDKITLPAGTYEVYYASYPYYHYRNFRRWDSDWERHGFFGNFFEWLFDKNSHHFDRQSKRNLYREFGIIISGKGRSLSNDEIFKLQETRQQAALMFLSGDSDESYFTQGLELTRPVTLKIYCLGEALGEGDYDYGWIMNLQNRVRVWQLTYRNSEPAGGAEKNRLLQEEITLQPGKYLVAYVTDDSHSPEDWNSAPPYDPFFWGLMLTTREDPSGIRLFEYSSLTEEGQILSLAPMQDDESASEGFTLKKDMPLLVYAIGEGRDDEMYDYGWIQNARTREIVWEMKYGETFPAGGAEKNRIFDGMVNLPADNYIAYFVTDDSHAYHDWNASPPYDQSHWGLTISVLAGGNKNEVASYQEEQDPSILAQLTRVRDHQSLKSNFILKDQGEVRIYALGEGTRGQMYDYGWIENVNSGKVVWEMSYRRTEHAGGARKNRLFNEVITLTPGEYCLHYKTDDSHSYNDWNDAPPRDSMKWGITVYLEK
jgi:hypothetical protein